MTDQQKARLYDFGMRMLRERFKEERARDAEFDGKAGYLYHCGYVSGLQTALLFLEETEKLHIVREPDPE